jgi:hypothetical protein
VPDEGRAGHDERVGHARQAMTRFLLNLALDLLFGRQEKIERRTEQPIKPSPMQGETGRKP